MKRNILKLILIPFLLFSMASCQKDDGRGLVSFALRVADHYDGGNSKVYMDGRTPVFIEDEEVRINGETYLIDHRNGSTAVYDVAEANQYYAIYPASWVNGSASAEPIINFPDMQVYRTDESGHQIVENPMVAYSTEDGTTLNFHNVASLANVHIHNSYGDVKIKYVAIYTDDTPLSGPATIDGITSSTPSVRLTSGITNVSIDCSQLPTLYNGNSTDIIFAMPPITNVVLYVDVYMTSTDGNTKYSFTKKTVSGKTIGRNQMGTINVELTSSGDDAVNECGVFWGTGDSEDDPFIIMDKEDLQHLQSIVAAGDDGTYNSSERYYLQTANIDLNEETSWAGIGTTEHPFEANYDGSEAWVKLNITSVSNSTGVFGYVGGDGDETFIKNLHVNGQIINNNNQAVGGVCGELNGNVLVDNCHNHATIKGTTAAQSAAHDLAGIIGKISGGAVTVQNCTNDGIIKKAYGYGGGIVGYVSAATSCTIQQCVNKAALNSTSNGYLGGICGNTAVAVTITKCTNHGPISGGNNQGSTYQSFVGGIVGNLTGTATLSNCHNSSTAIIKTTGARTGGIIGCASTGGLTIDGCLNEATVTCTGTNKNPAEVAGIIGYSAGAITINNCGNKGDISGQRGVAGMCGRCEANAIVTNSFCHANVDATTSNASGFLMSYVSGSSSSKTHTLYNCYYYGTLTGAKKGSLFCLAGNNYYVTQAYCYDAESTAGTKWGNTSSNTANAYANCKFDVSAGSLAYSTSYESNANNGYWSSGKTLLEALSSWRTTPLNHSGSAYGSSSDYLTWKANSDGFPTLNFDFIE